MNGPVPRVPRAVVRRRLLDAAADVFARRGYDGARLDEIAHVAGFTKGAVYSNFSGKHALLAALVEDYVRTELTIGTREIRRHDPAGEAPEDVAAALARRTVHRSAWSRLIVEIAQRAAHDAEVREVYAGVRRALREELSASLVEGCRRQGLELAVPVERLALALGALRMGLALEHGTDPDEIDQDTVANVFADTLRGATRAPLNLLP